MNERPAPSPPGTPPPALLRAGRAGSACPSSSPLSGDRHLPTPPHPTPPYPHRSTTRTPPPPSSGPPYPQPRPGPAGRGARKATADSEGHPPVRARPAPAPGAAAAEPFPAVSTLPPPRALLAREAAGARVPRGGARQTMGRRGEGSGAETCRPLVNLDGGT